MALFLSLLSDFAASGEFGEVRGDVRRDPEPAILVAAVDELEMLTLMLRGCVTEGVMTETAFGRGVLHCVHFMALGQLR